MKRNATAILSALPMIAWGGLTVFSIFFFIEDLKLGEVISPRLELAVESLNLAIFVMLVYLYHIERILDLYTSYYPTSPMHLKTMAEKIVDGQEKRLGKEIGLNPLRLFFPTINRAMTIFLYSSLTAMVVILIAFTFSRDGILLTLGIRMFFLALLFASFRSIHRVYFQTLNIVAEVVHNVLEEREENETNSHTGG